MAIINEQCDSCRRHGKVYYYAASRRTMCIECIKEASERAEAAALEHESIHRVPMLYPDCVWCAVGPARRAS